jgi:hypothetical protein
VKAQIRRLLREFAKSKSRRGTKGGEREHGPEARPTVSVSSFALEAADDSRKLLDGRARRIGLSARGDRGKTPVFLWTVRLTARIVL